MQLGHNKIHNKLKDDIRRAGIGTRSGDLIFGDEVFDELYHARIGQVRLREIRDRFCLGLKTEHQSIKKGQFGIYRRQRRYRLLVAVLLGFGALVLLRNLHSFLPGGRA